MAQKQIIFDAGPIINLTINNLLWILPYLKKASNAKFYIPYGVKKELIDDPLATKKYKLEALQILPYITGGIIEVLDTPQMHQTADEISKKVNNLMSANGHPVTLVHTGELTAIAACLLYGMDALVVDERTTRYLIETPYRLHKRMEHKLHIRLDMDRDMLRSLKTDLQHIHCLRSVELIAVAFKKGLFCHYTKDSESVKVPNIEFQLLEGLLWALKLNGCAISEEEVGQMAAIIKTSNIPCAVIPEPFHTVFQQ